MKAKSIRQQAREKNQKQRWMKNLTWSGIGIIVLALLGFALFQAFRPPVGEAVSVMPSSHIEKDTDPGEYNSNPPSSGPHYGEELKTGFYETNDYRFPAGYLVHNLEHGYVILWYNCDLLDEAGCAELKSQIKTVISQVNGFKIIAYPWPSLEVPFAMTSWGKIQKFTSFNAEQAAAFYRANLNKAPEPNAQ